MMHTIHWHAKPRQAKQIILTYPGFGMASIIATEYLITHADASLKAIIHLHDPAHAYVIIHEARERYPLSLYALHDTLLLTSLTSLHGHEDDLLNLINDLMEKTHAERIIILDAFAKRSDEQSKLYHHPESTLQMSRPLEEGVIIGIYPLLRMAKLPVTAYFAEAQPHAIDIPAAKLLLTAFTHETGINLDLKDLEEMSDAYKKRVHEVIQKQRHAQREREHQNTFYIG